MYGIDSNKGDGLINALASLGDFFAFRTFLEHLVGKAPLVIAASLQTYSEFLLSDVFISVAFKRHEY